MEINALWFNAVSIMRDLANELGFTPEAADYALLASRIRANFEKSYWFDPSHLREGCIGQVSEIMDANAPFEPRGCFAQAWGVAEILRAWSEINECENRRQTESVSLDSSSARRTAGG